MSVFSKTDNNNTSNLVGEINSMLSEMRKEKDNNNLTGGSSKSLVTEVNNLLSQIRGTKTNLTEDEVHDLADLQQGGAKKKGAKKAKSKSKSKGKKVKKAKSKSKSKSKAKAKAKSKSKSKSKGKMSRSRVQAEGDKKPKGQYMKDAGELKTFIMGQLPKEKLSYIAMSKPVSALLKENNNDVAKAKKNFDAGEFMKQYNASKKQMDANKEAKKAK